MSEVPSSEDIEAVVPKERAPIYPPDLLLKEIIDAAPDNLTKLKALLYLAFIDRCANHPIDKNEAAVFEHQMAAVFTTLKLSVVKGGKE